MDFWTELIKVVISNGIFATLFVFLFVYQLKDSAKREMEYQETIKELHEHLEQIKDVRYQVGELRTTVEKCINERKNQKL